MKKMEDNKGFTLVELLAVIVVLAIVMGLAVVGITSVLNNTRKTAFASNAMLFLEGAHDLVRSDEAAVLLGSDSEYAPKCNGSSSSLYIPISEIPLDQGGVNSPYNNKYLKGTLTDNKKSTTNYTEIKDGGKQGSYVKVTVDATCNYSYEIFLSDGVYAIEGGSDGQGAAGTSVPEANVNSSRVSTAKSTTNP